MVTDLMVSERTRTLRASFETSRMPHTTQFRRLQRGAEELYYFLLFTGDRYQDRDDPWRLWSNAGFTTGLQASPPGADPGDEIVVSMQTDGKHITLSIFSGVEATITALAELLQRVEFLRKRPVDSAAVGDLAQTLLSDPVLEALVRRSMTQAEAAGLRADELASMSNALLRDLTAFVHPGIASVVIECPVNAV